MRLLLQLLAVAVASLAVAGPHHARARDACNQTVSPYEEVTSPEAEPGRAVTCFYRLRTARKDLVLRLRFRRFKVGVLVNGTHCLRGFLQIVDGNAKTELSNRKDPGMFCGETEQPQTFISETSFVKVVFHVDNFTDQTYFSFESRVEQQLEVYARYGHHPELYPNRRGQVVPGSYCERVFRDCRLQTCYVQSPAYPGVYPRGLHCRYHLNTRLPFIKLYIENEVFNIDGQRCENIMTCPMRPISSGAENCPYDYIKVYDGKNESAPVIGVFCGMGHFPYSIIGTSEDLLVEFSSSAAGPLLNTGFHFNVGSWPGHGKLAGVRNGSCDWLLAGEDLGPEQEGIFQSVAHWYPPHSSCTYLLQGRPGQVVRLYFPSFRINTIEAPIQPYDGDCGESLTLYDASWADDARIIKTFCDTFSRAMEKHDFVSSGSSMFVRFESKTGSYSGSSLYYWAHYDFFNASRSGEAVAGSACDEQFVAWRSSSGYLRSPLNTLVYKRHADPHHSVRCQYRFVTDRRLFARVILTIESMAFKDNPYSMGRCGDCLRDRADKLVVLEPAGNASSPVSAVMSACLCHGGAQLPPLSLVSRGERLTLELRVDAAHAASSYFKHAPPLFEARYQFVHAPLCGPPLLAPAAAGELRFPELEALLGFAEPPRALHCIWRLAVRSERHLWLHFEDARLASRDCRLSVRAPARAAPLLFLCGANASALHELPVFAAADLVPPDDAADADDSPHVTVEFVSNAWSAADYFRMVWTELTRVEVIQEAASAPSSGEAGEDGEESSAPSSYYVTRADAAEDCEFPCPGDAGYCIPARLVCNGVANCPANASLAAAQGDEGRALCTRPDAADVNWMVVALSAGAAVLLALAVSLVVVCRSCCGGGRDSDKSIAGDVTAGGGVGLGGGVGMGGGGGAVDDDRAYDGYRR